MKKYLSVVKYLFSIHLLSLAFLSLFRVLLYFANISHVADTGQNLSLLFEALVRGIQFDNLIASYVMALPLLLWIVSVLCNKYLKGLVIFTNGYFIVCYSILFLISALDIRYFSYFLAHINSNVFDWLKFTGTTAGMIFQDASNYIFMALFLIVITVFSFVVIKQGKSLKSSLVNGYPSVKVLHKLPFAFLLIGLCFLGIRGTFQRYPLKVSFAYFCDNPVFNQLPINPAFYLLKSYQQSLKQSNSVNPLMNRDQAILHVKSYLGIISSDTSLTFRRSVSSFERNNLNVVVVLMESMSKANLSIRRKGKPITPYLNKLIESSYFFENFYSAGVHTNNGIVASLYSMPTQFNKPMMQDIRIPHYGGMPQVLQQLGYQTPFFVTGNPQYDSMNSFLRENNIERIFSIYDYPKEKVANNFGVQDDYLFQFGVDKLTEMSQSNRPFFATFLTVSNHYPFVIPDKFKNTGASEKEDIIVFADNAIKEFMEKAEKQKWYNNTIFVFLGDHGAAIGTSKYEMALSYNQIPLIIYSPTFKDAPKRFSQFGGQIDLFPTIMGLLGKPYTNNTLGIDLMKEKRQGMFFVNDTQLGCINQNYLYIRNTLTNKDILYDLHSKDSRNIYSNQHPEGRQLKDYAISMMVVGDLLRERNTPK